MASSSLLMLVALFALLVALAPFALHLVLRVAYPVHTSNGVVLVTGASTGIGRHAAESIARAHPGVTVYAGVRKQKDFDEINNNNSGGLKNLKPLFLSVDDAASCAKALEEIKATNLPLIALVNNAGISRSIPLEFHDDKDARAVFETNFFGMATMTRLFLPLLRQNKGRVVMISSVAGLISTPLSGIYSSTKFAMEAYADALRREVASYQVSVSVVEPAYVQTPIFESSAAASTAIKEAHSVELLATYGNFFSEKRAQKRIATLAQAPFPDTTTTPAILHALFDQYPETRYVVAKVGPYSAKVLVWLTWALPDRAVDLLVSKLTE